MGGTIDVTTQDGIATVTINNPARRNALDMAMRQSLGEALSDLMADRQCRVVILAGAAGHFSAGADVTQMADRTMPETRAVIDSSNTPIRTIINGPKLVIAAVEGVAAGAGMSLAAACDVVVAAKNARFIPSFMKIGLMPDMGLMWTLPQRVGSRLAKKIMVLAQPVSGEEAEPIGLADRVVDAGQTLSAARDIAAEHAGVAPLGLAFIKMAFANGCATLEDALRTEIDYQAVLRESQDHKGAAAAFLAKRPFGFTGR